MAENLRYTGNGCLNNTWDSAAPHNACKTHNAGEGESLGSYNNWTEKQVLYQLGAAMNGSTTSGSQGVCPNDWYVSTDNDWKILEGYVDSTYGIGDSEWNKENFRGYDAGGNLKSKTYWNGMDKYGFNALPAGQRTASNVLTGVGYVAYFWTSDYHNTAAWTRFISANSRINRFASSVTGGSAYGFSVRCILRQDSN